MKGTVAPPSRRSMAAWTWASRTASSAAMRDAMFGTAGLPERVGRGTLDMSACGAMQPACARSVRPVGNKTCGKPKKQCGRLLLAGSTDHPRIGRGASQPRHQNQNEFGADVGPSGELWQRDATTRGKWRSRNDSNFRPTAWETVFS